MTIITRKACEPGGFLHDFGNWKPLPPNVAEVVIDHNGAKPRYVTWQNIIQDRRERQDRILWAKRECGVIQRRAVRISVCFFEQSFYMGWHTYIDAAGHKGWGGRGFSMWLRGRFEPHHNPFGLMTLFPLGVSDMYAWMPAFAEKYQVGNFDGRPRGIVYCWALVEGSRINTILGKA